ncbi:MAG: GYD domain-containing protein [Miltoncostaeaceae bacterium]
MRTFILLSTLTHQGMETLAVTPERLLEVNREIEALGGRVLNQWAVLGVYDFLSIIEAPDEETVAVITMELSSRGSATFETLSAIEIEDLFEPSG